MSDSASLPHFVLTDTHLIAMVMDTEMDQQQFVSEVGIESPVKDRVIPKTL